MNKIQDSQISKRKHSYMMQRLLRQEYEMSFSRSLRFVSFVYTSSRQLKEGEYLRSMEQKFVQIVSLQHACWQENHTRRFSFSQSQKTSFGIFLTRAILLLLLLFTGLSGDLVIVPVTVPVADPVVQQFSDAAAGDEAIRRYTGRAGAGGYAGTDGRDDDEEGTGSASRSMLRLPGSVSSSGRIGSCTGRR